MKIGIDAMGGDSAPDVVIPGALMAKKELGNDVDILLIGNKNRIEKVINEENIDKSLFSIIHADKVIEMGEIL